MRPGVGTGISLSGFDEHKVVRAGFDVWSEHDRWSSSEKLASSRLRGGLWVIASVRLTQGRLCMGGLAFWVGRLSKVWSQHWLAEARHGRQSVAGRHFRIGGSLFEGYRWWAGGG